MPDTKLIAQILAATGGLLGSGETITQAAKANAPASLKQALSTPEPVAVAVLGGFAAMAAMYARTGRVPGDQILGVSLPG